MARRLEPADLGKGFSSQGELKEIFPAVLPGGRCVGTASRASGASSIVAVRWLH